jgi:hypothetical protein
MTTIANAIADIEFNTSFTVYVSVGSDEYLDIHDQNGDFVGTISPDEAESFVKNQLA